MAFDLTKWMKEDLGIDDAIIADVGPKLTPFGSKIEAGYLRQTDYSKQMDALKATIKTQQDELTAANERLAAEVAEWAVVQASGKQATEKMRTDYEAAQNDVLRLQQGMRKIATDHSLNYDDLVKGIEVKTVPAKADATPAIDMTKFVGTDQHAALTRMALRLPAQLAAIQHEHHELTGEWLNPETIIAEIETRAGTARNTKSLEARDVWEEMHGIPAKRTTKAKEQHDKEIADAEARGAERARSESQLPNGGAPPVGQHAPVFRGEHKSVLQRPAAGVPNQSAVTALRSGKYRQAPAGAPAAK